MNPFLCREALASNARAFLFLVALTSCQSEPIAVHPIEVRPSNTKTIVVDGRRIPSAPQESLSAKETEITVSYVGDVIIHDRIRRREEAVREGYRTIWSPIQNIFDQVDLSYANLEGPVAPELGGPSGFPHFNFPAEIISELKETGFDIVSTANNHALDQQSAGIKKTIEKLNKSNMPFTGTVSSEAAVTARQESWWALTPIKGTGYKLAWIACTEMTNGSKDKENQVLYCYKHKDKLKALIQELKNQSDVAGVIVTPHWGEEEEFEISSARKAWAQTMVNEGALAIVGSHPHVVQKIEDLVAQDGRRSFVAYSLGNFVSNQPWLPNRTTMMLFTKLKLNTKGKLEITDLKYIPLWMIRTIEKDTTAKYRIYSVFDMNKMPSEAVKIWNTQLGAEKRIKSQEELKAFLNRP